MTYEEWLKTLPVEITDDMNAVTRCLKSEPRIEPILTTY